jgi:hypothetical protein
MLPFQKRSRKASSRQQIAIDGVRDGVLLIPAKQYRMVLEVSSVNFELKSEDEQDALIESYQSFLNSLSSPLQILIRVREMDMDNYLSDFTARAVNEKDEQYQRQIVSYGEFVRSLITTNRILARRFYVVIPYAGDPTNDFDLIREQLALTTDIVSKGLAKLGIRVQPLSSLEILDLFYSFYNPELAKVQPMTAHTMQLLKESYL